MLRKEWDYLKENFLKYGKKPIFIFWLITSIYLFYKLWLFYILFILYIITSTFSLFIKKEPRIVIKNKKISIFVNYIKINILNNINNAKFNINFIPVLFFYYFFRIIFNMSYRIVKMSISLFDCLYNEYEWANMKNKKKTLKIINKYIFKSLEKWLYVEFIKVTPVLKKSLSIRKGSYEKTIKIIIK